MKTYLVHLAEGLTVTVTGDTVECNEDEPLLFWRNCSAGAREVSACFAPGRWLWYERQWEAPVAEDA